LKNSPKTNFQVDKQRKTRYIINKYFFIEESNMRKLIGIVVLSLIVSGFVMAQTPVTKENCSIEYDSAKKVVRLANNNADPYTIQYAIDGKTKSVVLDKNAVWEYDASKAAPKAIDIVKASKGGKVSAVDKDWKAITAAGTAPAKDAKAPAKDDKAVAPAKDAKVPAPAKDDKAAAPAKDDKAAAPAKKK
jgi:hypothetical protein